MKYLGMEIHSGMFAKYYQHRTCFDRVIEKIKRVQFFCPTGYVDFLQAYDRVLRLAH